MINQDAEFTVPESVRDALLPRHTVNSILTYAEIHVLWQHCCIHPPTFSKEVDAFWGVIVGHETAEDWISGGWASLEPTWIALLYVVLGIAVHQMDERNASRCGLSEGKSTLSAEEPALIL